MNSVLLILFLAPVLGYVDFEVTVSTNYVILKVGEEIEVNVSAICYNTSRSFELVEIAMGNEKVVNVEPLFILLEGENESRTLYFEGKSRGHTEVNITSEVESIRIINSLVIVDVYKYFFLYWFSVVLLWVYSVLFIVAYYPQILINYKRKSVIGLNFDFVLFSVIEHAIYFSFYVGINFFLEEQNDNYYIQPDHLSKFKPNAIVYNMHGIVVISILITQCFLYNKASQNILSYLKIAFVLMILFSVLFLSWGGYTSALWVNWLYSTIVIVISPLKFIPQILLNHKRKSTKGLSKAMIYLKLVSSILVFMQLVIDSINFDNWSFFYENPVMTTVAGINVLLLIYIVIQHLFLLKN